MNETPYILGRDNHERFVVLSPEARLQHLYVVGQTGVGKSGFRRNLALSDIKSRRGLCFLDPHGTEVRKLANKPAFLIVDEAQQYFDQNIDHLLTQVRKYRCGAVFAHQYLQQCSSQLLASLAANAAIKMASGVSTQDARTLAPDLRTTPDFILSQPRLHFATHIRGVTSQAVSIPVEAGKLEREPRMSADGREWFIEQNRLRVSVQPGEEAEEPEPEREAQNEAEPPEPSEPQPSPPPGPDDTAAKPWG